MNNIKKLMPALLILLITASSCNLFKKVTKETVKADVVKTSEITEESRQVTKSDQSVLTYKDEESDTEMIIVVEGNVNVEPTGNVSGDKATARINHGRILKVIQSQTDQSVIEATDLKTEQTKETDKTKVTTKESAPDNTLVWIVGAVLSVCIIIMFIYIKRKL